MKKTTKEPKREAISFKFKPSLIEDLQDISSKESRSCNNLSEMWLEEKAADYKKKNKK